ncbi:MAG: FliM/FliN family flagellar motor switch protein [Alkalilacustris sp.]
MRRALARAAQADCGLALAATEVRLVDISLAELLEVLEPHALLAVMEGPGERLGLMALSPAMLGSFIEHRTTGIVTSAELPTRRPTRTDAAMAADLIDRSMAELEAGLTGTPDLGWAGGYRYASFLDDPRPLGLLLEDVPYQMLEVTLDIASGARHGRLMLVLPRATHRRGLALPQRGDGRQPLSAAAETAAWRDRMTRNVMASPARLDAVLHRLRVPLNAALAWKPGDFVVLAGASVGSVRLESGGKAMGRARLGQARGQRALRLDIPPVEHPLPED